VGLRSDIRTLWGHVLERPAGAALAGLGVVLIVFSMVAFALGQSNATLGFAALGIAAVIAGALLPRLEEAQISASGARMKFGALTPEQESSLVLGTALEVSREQVDDRAELVAASRHYLAGEALAAVLSPRDDEEAAGAHFRVYLYDDDRERLTPVLFPGEDEVDFPGEFARSIEEWEVGKGATGTAYDTGEFVYVSGDAIWDTTYGVTPDQADRFRGLTAVAAIPIVNAAEQVIGVLTGTTDSSEPGPLGDEDEALICLLSRSLLVSRVLVDLLGWYPDRYDDFDGA
jgi:hypothetical protein